MYLIIRCENCATFSYIDRFQNWKLCPACGETMQRGSVPEYIEVENHHEADAIIFELERYLYQNNRENLTAEETGKLRAAYARLVGNSIR